MYVVLYTVLALVTCVGSAIYQRAQNEREFYFLESRRIGSLEVGVAIIAGLFWPFTLLFVAFVLLCEGLAFVVNSLWENKK